MKRLFIILTLLVLVACTPGLYTGGGWAESAGPGDSRASFGFDISCCDADSFGHFNLADEGWTVPVEMSGHVIDFGDLGDFGHDCPYYALLEYVSSNSENPGNGHAVVCFGEELPETEAMADAYGQVWISVQSGPYEGYENFGPVFGNLQSRHCAG